MRKSALTLVISCFAFIGSAQIEQLTIDKDSILTERVFLLKAIWNPGFVYEQPISSLSTVRIDAGVWWASGISGWPRGYQSVMYGGIYTDVELRHYFNLLRRTHNGRRTRFNSGEYLVAGFAHYLPPSFSENEDLTKDFATDFYFGVGVGHQRVFNWFFYDVSLQIGGHMLNQYWNSFGPYLEINAGFNLTRKKKQKR